MFTERFFNKRVQTGLRDQTECTYGAIWIPLIKAVFMEKYNVCIYKYEPFYTNAETRIVEGEKYTR